MTRIFKNVRDKLVKKKTLTSVSKNKLNLFLDSYNENNKVIDIINTKLKYRKIKKTNLPKEIAENIVLLLLSNLDKSEIYWDTKSKDIFIKDNSIKIKTFSGDSYSTFSPRDNWDIIYFLDLSKLEQKIFTLWEIPKSNTSLEWGNIRVTKKLTYKNKTSFGLRPRIQFKKLGVYNELNKKIIFSGKI